MPYVLSPKDLASRHDNMDETVLHTFLSFVFHKDLLQKHCWLSFKCLTPNFVAVVNIVLPICCHIGSVMPNLRIFVEDIVVLLCT